MFSLSPLFFAQVAEAISNMAGKSVMTYQPDYYKNDYKPIGAIQNSLSLWAMEQENIAHQCMYNGNISWMETDLKLFKTPQAMLYKYDQLNRITKSRSLEFSNNTYLERKGDKKYDEDYSYDANGNILTLKRHDDKAELADDFNYSYYANSNKLEKHKTTGNTYEYDAIGNLVKDYNEKMEIAWTPSGKVRSVTKSNGTNINFRYDATGNRIAKIVSTEAKTDTTIYVRDAGGNVMSIYNNRAVSEVPIYGSSRIGEYMGKEREGYQTFNLRKYEIANHLSNIIALISDKVNLYSSGRIVNNRLVCDSARATVVSASDYYPFGLPMPGREFSKDNYRYGFNGQEKVDEISGKGNHTTALFWEYDTRLGRRWNQDPKPDPSLSNYATFANNPIWFNDVLGDEVYITHRKGFLGLGKKETLRYENGKLFNKDGSTYGGKIRGFLKQSVEALGEVSKSGEGSSMLSELQSSKNIFNIVRGAKNQFVENDKNKAYANQWATDPTAAAGYAMKIAAGTDFSGGSGGTIFFNPNKGFLWEQGGNRSNRPPVTLGHEMFHGLDANRGLTDGRTHLGISRNEWQAVYRENTMRLQMGLPLRTDYITLHDQNTGISSPGGPSLLDVSGKPILPSWYKP